MTENIFTWKRLPPKETLSDKEQEQFAKAYERLDVLESPSSFAQWASGGSWIEYDYLKLLSDEIVDGLENDAWDILAVEVPVRHGKSYLLSRNTPAWFLCRYPELSVGLAGYEADFAATWGRQVRELINEHGDFFDIKVATDSRAANRWHLVGHNGQMFTAGVGGPITGKGGHLLILDDPIKNHEEANSQAKRDKIWDWYHSTFFTRREPGAKIIVIMSRWHQDDLIGRLISASETNTEQGLRFKRFRLPALAEENDPMGREPGDALCPERYTTQDLENIRIGVGPHIFASLYQQNPMPAEGAMFRPEKFNFYGRQTAVDKETGVESHLYILGDGDDRRMFQAKECWRFAMCDMAISKQSSADYTVVEIWDISPDLDMILVDVLRRRAEAPDHVKLLHEVKARYKPTYYGIEAATYGRSLIQHALREGLPIIPCEPETDKISRARLAQAYTEAGKVWIPKSAPWTHDFLDEVSSFPNGTHDDQVDAFAYAAIEVARGRAHAPRKKSEEDDSYSGRVWKYVTRRRGGPSQSSILGKGW